MTTNYGDTKIDEGFTIEIFNTIFFKNIIQTKISKNNKEHLANYIYQNSKQHKIIKIKTSSAFKKGNKYTIDDKYDLNRMNFILKYYKNHDIKNVITLYSKYERFS